MLEEQLEPLLLAVFCHVGTACTLGRKYQSKTVLRFHGDCPASLPFNDHVKGTPYFKLLWLASHLAICWSSAGCGEDDLPHTHAGGVAACFIHCWTVANTPLGCWPAGGKRGNSEVIRMCPTAAVASRNVCAAPHAPLHRGCAGTHLWWMITLGWAC